MVIYMFHVEHVEGQLYNEALIQPHQVSNFYVS